MMTLKRPTSVSASVIASSSRIADVSLSICIISVCLFFDERLSQLKNRRSRYVQRRAAGMGSSGVLIVNVVPVQGQNIL